MHSTYYLNFLWNNHSWYAINNMNDFVRAIVWCLTNLITGFCYVAIPYEIWMWRNRLKFISSTIIGWGFIAFITLCGMSHLAMTAIMPTGPWWAIIFVYGPMTIASLATWLFIRTHRDSIVEILELIGDLIVANNTDSE